MIDAAHPGSQLDSTPASFSRVLGILSRLCPETSAGKGSRLEIAAENHPK